MKVLKVNFRSIAFLCITILSLALSVPAGAIDSTGTSSGADAAVTDPTLPTPSPDTTGSIGTSIDTGGAGTATVDTSAATMSDTSSSTTSASSTTSIGDSTTKSPALMPDSFGSSDTALPDLFTGTMSYRIPIGVPAGRNRMDPGLSLLYRSGSGNGWVGVGWELEVGAIERNTKNGVDYNGADYIYRMPGARIELVKTGSESDGDVYKAKIEGAFIKFKKLTSGYWEARDKRGTRYLFGQTSSSRQDNGSQIFKWCLDRVTDTNGNYMEFTYYKNQGQIYVDQINYTGNDNTGAGTTNYIKLNRENRTDAPDMYTTNFSVKTAYRLSTIDIFANNSRVRTYKLTYDNSSSTGRSVLSNVQHYDKNGTSGSALPVTTFTYSGGGTSFEKTSWSASTSEMVTDPYNYKVTGDFNGDGKMDIAYTRPNWSGWKVLISTATGSGFTKSDWAASTSEMGTDSYNYIVTGDFNGDGKTDIAYTRPNWSGWKVLISTGSGFTKSDWVASTSEMGTDSYNYIVTGDFNGDGKTDIAYTRPNWSGWKVLISTVTGSGFTKSDWAASTSEMGTDSYNYIVTGDFNGDGKTDIAYTRPNWSGWKVLISTGSGFTKSDWAASTSEMGTDSYNYIVTGDFNGDGKTDIAYTRPNWSGWKVLFSTGSGFTKSDWAASTSEMGTDPYNYIVTGDFNGDGKTDIAYTRPNWSGWKVLISTGSGFTKSDWAASTSEMGTDPYNYIVTGDFDGDGKMDIAYTRPNWSGWNMLLPNDPFPDRLYTVSNGLGATTTITYAPSTDTTVVSQNTQLPFPVQVVSSISSNDGKGNTSTTNYTYSGGFYHIGEKDFRGFNYAKVTGAAGPNGEQKVVETWFHQGNDTAVDVNDPDVTVGYMKGKPYRIRVTDGSGNKYSEATTSYVFNNTSPYFNPPYQVDSYIFDGDSTWGKQTRVIYASYDSYGNITTEYQYGDYSDSSDNSTITRSFGYNTTSWIVGFPIKEGIYEGLSTADTDKVSETKYYYDGINTCDTPSTNQNPDKGNLTRISRWLSGGINPDIRMAYDSYGNLNCSRDANGNKTTISYDGSFFTFPRFVRKYFPDQTYLQTETKYYNVDAGTGNGLYGQVKSVIDPNNATTSYEYDTFGRRTKTTLPDNSYTTISYNSFGGGVGAQNVQTYNSAGLYNWMYFDGLGRTIIEKSTGPAGKVIATETIYDVRGAVRQKSLPYFDGIEPQKYSTYTYDPVGRMSEVTNPDNTKVKSCYNDWLTVTIDANNHKKRATKDAYGKLIRIEEYTGTYSSCDTGTGVLYATTNYAYDALGNLLTVTDAHNNATSMAYDTLGRKTYMHDPDMRNWNYYYDANGNLTSQVDSKGQYIYFQYDALNRLRQKDYTTQKVLGSGDVVYNYDETHTSYGKGRLTSMKDQSGAGSYAYNTRYFYDTLGQVSQVDKVINGVQYTTEATYDDIGRLSSIKYPNLSYSHYTYNGPFLNSVHDGITTYASYSIYNALGQTGTVTYGNGVTTSYTYFSNNYRLNTINSAKGGTVLQNMTYGYDNAGNVTVITDPFNGNQSYGYDELNRLTSSLSTVYPVIIYSYNKIGNMLSNSQVGTYTYPTNGARPHAVTTAGSYTYAYDDNGNMTGGAGRTITYDPENRPMSITSGGTTTTFFYDGNGERVRKTSGATTTTYIGELYECNGSTCYKYIFANGQRIARRVIGTPNVLYYHADHLGGSSVVTDVIGNKVENITYYPYGATRTDSGGPNVRHKYTGQELDAETGLYFYNARYYDPALGRFISADSIIPDPGDPQAFNRYAYTLNNPLRYTDPSGHCPICVSIAVGAAVGAVVGGTMAAVTGHDVVQGMEMGAVSGAFFGAGAGIIGGAQLGTYGAAGVYTAAGAAGGATNASMYGGNVEQAAEFGGAMGLAGAIVPTPGFTPFGDSAFGSILNQEFNAGLTGAAFGGAYASATGGDIKQGMTTGATAWAIGAGVNQAVGHGLGYAMSDSHEFKDGKFYYYSKGQQVFTVGGVIIGDKSRLDEGAVVNGVVTDKYTVRQHEIMQHGPQQTMMGPGYLPAHIAAQGFSLMVTGGQSTHQMNPFESYGAYPSY